MYILKSHELTDLESFVLWRGYFSDPVYVQTYEQQISFCYHLPCSVTLFVSLLHCFHPENYFVLHL